jgi:hypothetical protein
MSTFYLPVATQEMVEMAEKLKAEHGTKHRLGTPGATAGKTAYGIIMCTDSGYAKWKRRRRGDRLLANVPVTEKLYVLIHGLVDREHRPIGLVGARRGAVAVHERGLKKWQGGTMRSYTPEGLAQHLEAEGLSKQFVDLRLFACYGGAASSGLPSNHTFAQELKAKLVGLRYASIQVTGYRGALSDGYLHVGLGGANAGRAGIAPEPHAPHLSATQYKTVEVGGERVIASMAKETW